MSVLSVLATGIPPDSVSLATANPSAFSAQLASSLSAGQTPEWYQALPSDVKSYLPKLYPNTVSAVTTASETAAASLSSSLASERSSISASISSAANSTAVAAVSSAALAPTGGANSATTASTGGASYPTAVGAGIAGAMGFLGMLAL
ncbi:hypothetical protein K469DRAFT_700758 [Zopfia rhizophila CBS 207.26]|uniref:Uncharacterized protein n=1 Tax=Zopfia rhizophila CBS 207.26 TaxID=1314779 RepID=A0A6A6EG74_9PEZI|nr:hypothetical protein K469DRAFT_700758 [Zopfia rhizophila CBS 207.26]